MENLINSTSLVSTAEEVRALFTSALETLNKIEEIASPCLEAHYSAYHDYNRSYVTIAEIRESAELSADDDLFTPLRNAISKLQNSLGNGIGDIESGLQRRSASLERVNQRVERELLRQKKIENEERAETIERIESDYLKIAATIETEGRGKSRRAFAKLIFQLAGTVYQVRAQVKIATNDFYDERLGYQIRDFKTDRAVELFTGSMEDEDVAKAAHALDSIKRDLRALIGPVSAAEAA